MNAKKSILVVGVGSIGERHTRCFLATGRADVSICEVNPSLRETVASRYGIKHAYDDLNRALANRPDGVVICTPAHLHITQATAVARAGSNLLIEKPLSTDLNGVQMLQDEIQKRHLTTAVAYVFRAHPALTAMREAIRSGRFGRPLQIVGVSGQHFPYYRPAYRETYYKDRATGGGAVQDAITHLLNAGEWLVGPIHRLTADVGHLALPGVTVEDTVHVLTRHGAGQNSVMGCFSLNQHQAPNETSLTAICERGTVRFEYHNACWRWADQPGGEWHSESFALDRDTLFIEQAKMFLDALAGKGELFCPLNEAVQTLRVNLAVLTSAEKNEWQTI